jgi:hypothetical protein
MHSPLRAHRVDKPVVLLVLSPAAPAGVAVTSRPACCLSGMSMPTGGWGPL